MEGIASRKDDTHEQHALDSKTLAACKTMRQRTQAMPFGQRCGDTAALTVPACRRVAKAAASARIDRAHRSGTGARAAASRELVASQRDRQRHSSFGGVGAVARHVRSAPARRVTPGRAKELPSPRPPRVRCPAAAMGCASSKEASPKKARRRAHVAPLGAPHRISARACAACARARAPCARWARRTRAWLSLPPCAGECALIAAVLRARGRFAPMCGATDALAPDAAAPLPPRRRCG
jgi:hypothetical protein